MCPCTKFEVIWTNENRAIGQRNWRIFNYVKWKNELVGILFPTNMAVAVKMYGNVPIFLTVITLAFIVIST